MIFTDKHIEFIKANIKGRSYTELTDIFNIKFGLNFTPLQIKNKCQRHRICNHRNTQYQKGCTPWNTGKTFPPLSHPYKSKPKKKSKDDRKNYKSVGSEHIVKSNGYTIIKTPTGEWRHKHIIVWESVNGALPKGCNILFADKNKRNFDINNLIKVNLSEIIMLNKFGLISNDAGATKTGLMLVKLILATTKGKEKLKRIRRHLSAEQGGNKTTP
jgi:hypothetical protein